MRITSIELAGEIDKGNNLPHAFARISRKLDTDEIEVAIFTPDDPRNELTRRVPSGCGDLWPMAQWLQFELDGCKGTNSMIHDYFLELRRFED